MIKQVDFNIKDHSIAYRINWLGVASVFLDGRTISKKLSLGKRVHTFNLDIDGAIQTFHLESKQSFTFGTITVSLFQNGTLIETKVITLYNDIKGAYSNTEQEDNSNTMFIVGILLVIVSLSFDWNKVFLFLGLIFIFDAVSKAQAKTRGSDEQNEHINSKD